jgi:hypothetical protein
MSSTLDMLWLVCGCFCSTDGFDQDRIAVYFNHDHYVFVALLGSCEKPACLVGEYCFAYVIYSREIHLTLSCP